MEVFYCFYLGPVAVAGIITDSRKKNGEIIAPVNKSIEIKPGVLLSLNGPYEDNMEYMEFFKERYDRYPDMTGEDAINEFKRHIGLEEIDSQGYFALVMNTMKNGRKWPQDKMERAMAEIQSHPVNKMMEEKRRTIDEAYEINKSLIQYNLIENTRNGFNHFHGAISDVIAPHLDKYLFGDACYLHFGGIPIDDSQSAEAGQRVLDLNKKMKQYIPQAKKNPSYGASILKTVIKDLHLINIRHPQPLNFLQVGPHTDYRWIPLEE